MNRICKSNFRKQQGAALVTSLIILLILTMIGISSISGTSSELRRTTNSQERMRTNFTMQAVANYVLADIMRNPARHGAFVPRVSNLEVFGVDSVGAPMPLSTAIPELAYVPHLNGGQAQIVYKGLAPLGNVASGNDWASGFGSGKDGGGEIPVFEAFVRVDTTASRAAQARFGVAIPRSDES